MYKVTLEYENGKYTITAKANEDTEVRETESIPEALDFFRIFVDDVERCEAEDKLS